MTDSQDERALLESKDRGELLKIAEAASVVVPPRARKPGIINAILGGASPTKAEPAEPKPAERKKVEPKQAEEVGVVQSAPETEAVVDGPSSAAPVGASAGAAPQRGSGQDRSSRDKGGQDRASGPKRRVRRATGTASGEGASGGQNNGGGEPTGDRGPDASPGDSSQQGQQGQQGRSKGQAAIEEIEAGNRRRRRRGRGGNEIEEQWQGEPVPCEGVLDLRDEGYGFLRTRGLLPSADDVYVAAKQVRQYGLRKGDHLNGASRPASRNEKNPTLLRVEAVNGSDPEVAKTRPAFDELTPLFPDERFKLEIGSNWRYMTARVIDLVAPIGKGQRGLIVSPPKAGKTTIMKQIAKSIEENNPEVEMILLLIDERPEEVTDMRRSIKGEVIASTFDRPTDEHIQIAELTIERAKRLVESGSDVVIILDGITRLARAYNLAAPGNGRVMSGGIDAGALYPPKKFFGAARNLEEGGSLTILATALVETGSRMDEVIFEEFKGTGNMELRLDRSLAERRVFPAIAVEASSTRHEELLLTPRELDQIWKLRKVLAGIDDNGIGGGLELLLERMGAIRTNEEFLAELSKAGKG